MGDVAAPPQASHRNAHMNTVTKAPPPTMEEAIDKVGIGHVQWILLIMCGLTFTSDAAEVTFLSYVTEVLKCEWGLTSQQESYITSAVFAGMILGSPFWGVIADKMGRRPSFLISSVVITCFGFITACCQCFWQLLLCRAIVGFGVSGLPVGFDILAEALPSSGRGRFLLYIEYFWTLGSIYVNVCAWGCLQRLGWQVFTALAAVPTLIASIMGYVFLPESPRWLVAEGREKEALVIINNWAKNNGKEGLYFESVSKESVTEGGYHLQHLITKRTLRKSFFLMSTVWFAFGLAYYGIVLLLPRIFQSHDDKVTKCTGDVEFDFQDLAIASTAEVIGVIAAVTIIDNPGRSWCQGIFYSIGAASALALGFRSLGLTFLTCVASIGRLAEMAASCATWVHTPELFPTQLRAEVHGILNLISKVGAFLAPYLISDIFTQKQCGCIMAGFSLAAGISAFFLTETSGKELTDFSDTESTDEGSDDGTNTTDDQE